MLTDEYLTWLFIKHGIAQHGGAGEGESLSVSTEHSWPVAGQHGASSRHRDGAANSLTQPGTHLDS